MRSITDLKLSEVVMGRHKRRKIALREASLRYLNSKSKRR